MTEQTRWLRIGCAFDCRAEIETPTVFQVQPRGDGVQVTVERWLMQPDVPVRHYRDLGYEALAEVPDVVDDVAEDAAEVPPGQAAG